MNICIFKVSEKEYKMIAPDDTGDILIARKETILDMLMHVNGGLFSTNIDNSTISFLNGKFLIKETMPGICILERKTNENQ